MEFRYKKSGLICLLLAAACARDATVADFDGSSSDTVEAGIAAGGIRGTVRDALTDEPIPGARVSAGSLGAVTDGLGTYGLAPIRPGSLKLEAYQRGFEPGSLVAIIDPGVSTLIDFPLAPAEAVCCDLDGFWSAEFVLDSAGLNAPPASRSLVGELVFDRPTTDELSTESLHRFLGESRVEFQELLGSEWSVLESAEASVFYGDSVAITLVPQFADWGLEMLGRVSMDTVQGIWYQRASCCGAYGSFTLIRTARAE